MKLAAIDIGSNAARLLISDAIIDSTNQPTFTKLSLVRVPLRLGFDVFEKGEVSASRITMLLETMQAYKHLLNAYDVLYWKACATSAMRDATNAKDILQQVKQATGIDIEIISGDFEASLIYENHVAEHMNIDRSYLYIDVGGGSTELTLFAKGKLVFKESFNIGTIRLLKEQVDESTWEKMKTFLKQSIKSYKNIDAIGSGGNINKIFTLSKKKENKPLTFELLRDYYKELSSVSLEKRITLYKLREDRADVIVPALLIFTNIMRWAEIKEIYVPKIGLADGLIQHLYDEIKTQ